ncbi:MAG TPA: hypothetical protein VNS81_06590 [Nocardioides sp.]|nr:hypothetical protein [Nocardioides sp.]
MAGPIRIAILGDSKDFERSSAKVDAALQKTANRSQKVSKAINAGAKVAAVGFLAVGAGAVKLAQGAAEDEKASAALAKTLQNTAGATKGQVKATEDWITAQGKALGVADDQLRPALSKLATATGDVGKAQKLTSLAMDISAGSGKSLESVAGALAKAQNGSVGGLAKLGIATKDASGKTKTFAALQGELASKFKGQAATAAGTLEGKMGRVKLALSEAGESIGYALIPALTTLSTWLNDKVIPALTATFGWMQDHQTTVKVIGASVAALGAAFIVASVGMKVYAAGAKIVAAASKAWAAVQWLLNAAMSANPIALVVIAIAALAIGLVIAYKKSETFRKIVNAAFGAVKATASAVAGFFTNKVPAAFNKISTAAGKVLGWVKGNWPKILAFLTGPIGIAVLLITKNWGKIKDGAKSVYDGIKQWLGKALNFITGLPAKIASAFSGIWNGIAGSLRSAINSVLHLPISIPKINTHIPGVGTVGGQTLIPKLARGGITTGPTLAMVGDNPGGREAVIPLDRYDLSGGQVVDVLKEILAALQTGESIDYDRMAAAMASRRNYLTIGRRDAAKLVGIGLQGRERLA